MLDHFAFQDNEDGGDDDDVEEYDQSPTKGAPARNLDITICNENSAVHFDITWLFTLYLVVHEP